MKVLSLFDGLAGTRVALDRLGIPCEYYASEIDKYATKVALKNYPDIKQLGDIKNLYHDGNGLTYTENGSVFLNNLDLFIGGSPCTSLSNAGRQKESGLLKGKSTVLWDYIQLLEELQPKWFLLENVSNMPKADRNAITELLGVEPILIDSALVSAQSRKRYYWTNIPTDQPEDLDIKLEDVVDGYVDRAKAYCVTATYRYGVTPRDYLYYNQRQMAFTEPVEVIEREDHRLFKFKRDAYKISNKRKTGEAAKAELRDIKKYMRKLTPEECEQLQTLPVGYTRSVSKTQRYKMIGNGFTIAIIKHILKGIMK